MTSNMELNITTIGSYKSHLRKSKREFWGKVLHWVTKISLTVFTVAAVMIGLGVIGLSIVLPFISY